jgi:aspartyl/asparaginyl beta-hydroxylase (cupin superfamily)
MKIMENIYYNIYRERYKGANPEFYDSKVDKAGEILSNNVDLIRDELLEYLSKGITEKKAFFRFNNQKWFTIELYIYTLKFRKAIKQFPTTTRIVNSIPGVVTINFSLLRPGAKLTPHCGETNTTYRYHLALIIPQESQKCGLSVNNVVRSWEKDKCLVFCDAHYRYAWNNSNEDRWVLIVDVLKPEYKSQEKHLLAKILSAITITRFQAIMPFMLLFPKFLTKSIHYVGYIVFRFMMHIKLI